MSEIIDAYAYSAGHLHAEKLVEGLAPPVVSVVLAKLRTRLANDDELTTIERSHYHGAIDYCEKRLRERRR